MIYYKKRYLSSGNVPISTNEIQSLKSKDKDDEEIIVITLDELNTYYEKKKKESYFINEDRDESIEDEEGFDSERNQLLDKYSELKSKDIIDDNGDELLTESIDVIKDIDNSENLSPDTQDLKNNNDFDLEKIDESELKPIKPGKFDPSKSDDVKEIFNYLDDLLGSLPEDKIKIFANSKYFKLYKKLLKELGVN